MGRRESRRPPAGVAALLRKKPAVLMVWRVAHGSSCLPEIPHGVCLPLFAGRFCTAGSYWWVGSLAMAYSLSPRALRGDGSVRDGDSPLLEFVTLRLQGELFALPLASVTEVMRMVAVTVM